MKTVQLLGAIDQTRFDSARDKYLKIFSEGPVLVIGVRGNNSYSLEQLQTYYPEVTITRLSETVNANYCSTPTEHMLQPALVEYKEKK